MGFISMKRITPVLIVLAALAFASTPFLVHAAQISPTPTPNTGTITVDTPDAFNSLNPFENNGVIECVA